MKLHTGKYAFLAWFGGSAYVTAEVFWRERSHWAMFALAALLFICIGLMNNILPWELGLVWQVLIGTVMVTALELIVGLIVNRWLGWGVWDYSNMWGNVLGQICPLYTLLWSPLVLVGIAVDDYLRWFGFGEDKPHYKLI